MEIMHGGHVMPQRSEFGQLILPWRPRRVWFERLRSQGTLSTLPKALWCAWLACNFTWESTSRFQSKYFSILYFHIWNFGFTLSSPQYSQLTLRKLKACETTRKPVYGFNVCFFNSIARTEMCKCAWKYFSLFMIFFIVYIKNKTSPNCLRQALVVHDYYSKI